MIRSQQAILMFRLAFPFALVLPCLTALGQLPTADLSRITPSHCKAGQQVEVNVSGKNLEDLTQLRFTHAGITAQRKMLPADEWHPNERPDGNKFLVTVAADTPPGIYEARTIGFFGYSTAKAFVVADASSNEIHEPRSRSTRETALELNVLNGDKVGAVVSSFVAASGIDWYRFKAKADTRVLIQLFAERIDSRMDGQLILYDSRGRELDRNRDWFGRDSFLELNPAADGEFYLAVSDILYRGGNDYFYRLDISNRPHIDFIYPPAGKAAEKGTYTIFGRNLPGSISPAKPSQTAEFGSHQAVRRGRPLESVEVEIPLPSRSQAPDGMFTGTPRQSLLPGMDFRYKGSNPVRIGFATAPVESEYEASRKALVSVPVEIAGSFDEENYEDSFRFTAEQGKTYVIEAIADRMQSQVDPLLIVSRIEGTGKDKKLTVVSENDDLKSYFPQHGKTTINADTTDAAILLKPEQSGDYKVTIVNQYGSGDAASLYRLAIRNPVHDFALLATTEQPLPTGRTGYSVTPHLRAGARWGVRVIAPRQDGFADDIVVTAEDLPSGVSASPLTLYGEVDEGYLVLAADDTVKDWSGDIKIIGRSTIDGKQVARTARFNTIVWGHIFADSIRVRSRPTTHVPLSTNGHEQAPFVFDASGSHELTVKEGETLEVPVEVIDNRTRTGGVTIEPYGIYGMHRRPPSLAMTEDATSGTLKISFKKNGNFDVRPGKYSFVLHATGTAKYRHNVPANVRTGAQRRRIREVIEQLETSGADKSKLQAAKKAQQSIDNIAKSAAALAVEKSEKFSAWSQPLTVEVLAAD